MEKINWICVYCNQPQTSLDFPPMEGETKPYKTIIQEAAKSGSIACEKCYKSFFRSGR